MKKLYYKVLALVAAVAMLATPVFVNTPVFADCGEGCIATNILDDGDGDGCFCKEGKEAVFYILGLIVRIMSGLVMTAAVLGIIICGVQYLTARDNEGQVAKAKSRLLQVIIGMFVYMLMWAFLEWLIPGGAINEAINGGAVIVLL